MFCLTLFIQYYNRSIEKSGHFFPVFDFLVKKIAFNAKLIFLEKEAEKDLQKQYFWANLRTINLWSYVKPCCVTTYINWSINMSIKINTTQILRLLAIFEFSDILPSSYFSWITEKMTWHCEKFQKSFKFQILIFFQFCSIFI